MESNGAHYNKIYCKYILLGYIYKRRDAIHNPEDKPNHNIFQLTIHPDLILSMSLLYDYFV